MKSLGKYDLLEKIGESPLGYVYRACDRELNRIVALVTFDPDTKLDPVVRENFKSACGRLLRLKHPHIPAFFEQGEALSILYLASEFVDAVDLRKLIAQHASVTLERKLKIMSQVASAVGCAHAEGLVHGNLHPGNIRLLPDDIAKVVGFGLAHRPDSRCTGVALGQADARYLSPEQLQGSEPEKRSDIFCAGLVLYELLTGTHPFHDSEGGKPRVDDLGRINFPTVEKFPGLPLNLWPVLERCLAMVPEDRYSSMLDFDAACESVLEELAEDSNLMRIELQSALPKLRRASRRVGAPASLAALHDEVNRAVSGEGLQDYQSLNRLVLAVAAQHPYLECAADAAVRPQAATRMPDDAPEAPGKFDEPQAAPRAEAHDSWGPPFRTEPESVPVSESSPGPPGTDDELSPSTEAPTDNLFELLRKIDQGQETTRKLVDSFMAGRKATAQSKEQKQDSGSRMPAGSAGCQAEAHSPLQAGTETRPAAVLPLPVDEPAEAGGATPSLSSGEDSAKFAEAVRRKNQSQALLWLCAAALLLATAIAIPWVHERINRNVASGGRTESSGAVTSDPAASALRKQLEFARRDYLLEEAQILRTLGRNKESAVFLERLLELYPGYVPAQQELNRVKIRMEEPAEKENP